MSSPSPAAAPAVGLREPAPPGRPRRARRRTGAGTVLAGLAAAVLAVAALAPSVLAPGDPHAIDLTATLGPPSPAHWFGTDEIGRDLYTRLVHGTGQSLVIGVGAAAVALVLALLLAGAAALGPRPVAAAADRVVDVLFAFPTLLLALLLVSVLSPSPQTLVVAVGVGVAPGYARMVRAQLLGVRLSPYVEAATALGHRRSRIIGRHVLPNALRPLVAVFALSIGQCVVWASSLSFLGLGVAPPAAEWGALLEAGRAYLTVAGWLVVLPGLAIVALAVTATTVGRALQTHLEPGE
ncbi:ABC transporter permease [Pseudonocardia sp. MH-G8]|uniref:ABC transporter permease n=1 Tax=Pseudonocardia sp. MH-G8 TaxID=1854588 RepID=UPI000BA11F1F|nr:ABC transporter permease [Pseudonocardia sp. MH-G8]OZM78875.1 peptide ABC transporter permease [Pseudonocardia sp. MH-G8]